MATDSAFSTFPRWRRILLWLSPLVLVVGGTVGLDRARAVQDLEEARDLLVAGDFEMVETLLEPLRDSLWVGARARTGLRIVQAFHDDDAARLDPAIRSTLDPDAFALPLVIRTAFERGEFEAVLRLTELAEALGRPTVPLVTVAARIEDGRSVEPTIVPEEPVVTSRLAIRVADHLTSPLADGVTLRDRTGRPIGRLAEGLELAETVDEHWIPRAVADLAGSHPEAGSLRLSLDLELTRAAAHSFGRFRGSIVLVDPWTGEILAAVSDRRTHDRAEGTPAFDQAREPASISKIVTAAAYLRAGRDPDARLGGMRCRGHAFYDGEPVYCPYIAGPLRGLDRALAVSCNVAFAELGVELGRERVLDELRRWGFGRRLGGFPGGRVVKNPVDDRELADLSIGLEASEITPLHAALLASVVANGGRLPEPSLLQSSDGRLGLHPRPVAYHDPEAVLEAPWVEEIDHAMRAVVDRGTAMRVRTPGFPVAMKTGTASHPRYGFHVNYIGYGPLPDARVAFAVRITNQGTSKQVRYAAAEVTARLLRNLRTISRERGWDEGGIERRPPPRLARLGADSRDRLADRTAR